jgi:TolB-like protein/DNA-binding winged helix-turn-helix (wHTH) protein/tetratricopeptide (TPR) repeat protein
VSEVAPSRGVVCFSAFEVDFRNGEVRKHGFKIRVQDQPFHVLQILLEHPGELVSREELQRQIWPADTFVDFEKGLNNAIKRLRDALGDSAEQPRFIETHSRRGYRFIGSLNGAYGDSLAEIALPTAVAPATSRLRYRALTFTALGLLLVGVSVFSLDIGGLRSRLLLKLYPPGIHSLAVLPLRNLSSDATQEYFADGMTDALITDLAQIGTVKVISRTSSMQYKQTKKSLPEIARELNVDGIVEGTVQHSGDRVRITAQLIHGPTDKHLWANSYERDMRDMFALERDVTEEIARQVRARLRTPSDTPLARPLPVSPEALDAYLQGNYYLTRGERGLNDEEKKRAAEYFQRAIDAEPGFIPAYIGLADAHHNRMLGSIEDTAIRKKAAEKAFALDPNSSDGLNILAGIKWDDFDWSGAEREYRQAIALNPNNGSVHGGFSDLLGAMGRLDEALREAVLAQELDPNEDQLSNVLCWRGEYDRAIGSIQKRAASHPDDGMAHYELYRLYVQKGAHKEAVEELVKAFTLFGMSDLALNLQRAFAAFGWRGAMRQFAKDVESLQAAGLVFAPENLAVAYVALGDKDRAFYWLEQGYDHREMVGHDWGVMILKVDPLLAPLRSDPRFKDLLRRMGLPP